MKWDPSEFEVGQMIRLERYGVTISASAHVGETAEVYSVASNGLYVEWSDGSRTYLAATTAYGPFVCGQSPASEVPAPEASDIVWNRFIAGQVIGLANGTTITVTNGEQAMNIMNITDKLRSIDTSADDKILAKYGITNTNGQVMGEVVVLDYALKAFKAEIAADLRRIEADEAVQTAPAEKPVS